MKQWDYRPGNILEITFEGLMSDYDHTFRMIFEHMRFSGSERAVALKIAAQHDIGWKSSKEIEKTPHVSSPRTTKWKEYFGARLRKAFLDKFAGILVDLGYETSNRW
jgi:hypothetical protein